MPKFLVPVDLTGNELQNALLQQLGTAPSATAGRFYLDTSTTPSKLKYHNGTGWITLDGVVVAALDDLTDVVISSVANGHTLVHNGTSFVNVSFDTRVRTSRLDQMAAPTAAVSLNSQKITALADATVDTDAANLGVVNARIAALVDSAPGTLDTLNELAAALGDDANFATTTATSLSALDTRLDTLEAASNVHKYSANVGDGSSTTIQVTHNLGTKDVAVSVFLNSGNGDQVIPDIQRPTINRVDLVFSSAPASNAYRVTVMG